MRRSAVLWSWLQRSHRHEPQGVRLIDDVVRPRLLAAARCGRRPTQPTSRCAGLRRTEIRSRSAVSNIPRLGIRSWCRTGRFPSCASSRSRASRASRNICYFQGGSAKADAEAGIAAWRDLLAFLDDAKTLGLGQLRRSRTQTIE
jgi:hypothetical protein